MERSHSCTASMPSLSVEDSMFLLVIGLDSLESILLGENALQFDDSSDQSLLVLNSAFFLSFSFFRHDQSIEHHEYGRAYGICESPSHHS